MKPIVLKGHSKPIKDLKFNSDGDLLFSGSNDRLVTLWASETGERIGTYQHQAAVYDMSITLDSKILVTGDSTGGCYFWEVGTGTLLKKLELDPTFSIRSVDLAYGDGLVSITSGGRTREAKSYVDVYSFRDILGASTDRERKILSIDPIKRFTSEKTSKFSQTKWLNMNRNILTTTEDGFLQMIDYNTGEFIRSKQIHSATIMDMDISPKEEVILTASKDGKSLLIDPDTFDIMKTFHPQNPTRNINTCKLSPLISTFDENEEKFHAIIAGGQESRDVTTSHAKKGGFDLLIYNLVQGDEVGAIQGHFGPVNTIAFSPNGNIIASGAEDATIRIHKLDCEEYENLSR